MRRCSTPGQVRIKKHKAYTTQHSKRLSRCFAWIRGHSPTLPNLWLIMRCFQTNSKCLAIMMTVLGLLIVINSPASASRHHDVNSVPEWREWGKELWCNCSAPDSIFASLLWNSQYNFVVQKQALVLNCIVSWLGSTKNEYAGYSLVAIGVARVLWSWLS